MTEIITIAEDHSVSYSSGAFVLNLTIDNQNAVDRIEFVLPESVGNPADWAWRVEISQNGETSFVALVEDVVWVPRAGAVTYGKCELQLVGVQPAEDGSYNRVWKSRVFKANVLESINAIVDAEQASELDDIVLKVEGYKDAAEASAQAAASSASAAQAAQTEAEAAQDAAEDAQSAAETAQGKAEAAQAAAETARAGAETARTQAQAAQNAAETAQGKAEDAQEAAEAAQAAAEGAAEDLSAAVASAAQSASSAAQSATDAYGYASAASSSATAAAGSATTAQGHASAAQTARAGAESAQSAAETAQGLAEDAQEAAESARDAAQSAQSAAESAKSGAEAAKSDAETAKTAAETAAGSASDDADAAASSASAAAQSAQAAQEAAQTALGIIDDDVVAKDSTWSSKQIIDVLCPPLEETGNPVQCYPVAGYPLSVKASWEPRQEGEGEPSPENVRPIVGLDGVTVQQSGKTLMPYTKPSESSYTTNGVTFTWNDDGSIHISGTAVGRADSNVMNFDGFYLPPGTYRMTPSSQSGVLLQFVVKKGSTGTNIWYGSNVNITIENGDVPQYFYVTVDDGATVDTTVYAFLSYGTDIPSADDYEPYTGTTATLSLPSTVYGGEVDMATGEGMETFYSIVLNGTEGWVQNSGGDFGLVYFEHQIPNSSALFPSSGGNIANAKQSQVISHFMIGNPYSENVDNAGFVYNTKSAAIATVRIRASQFENTDDWKTYLSAQHSAGTPVTIAYKLATPQPIQATGFQPLPAISGQNGLTTNADSLTVTGRADPNHTIQTLSDRIAALESETIEGGTSA